MSSAFFSFHYQADAWRAAQVKAMCSLETNTSVADNEWQTIVRRGDDHIRAWVDQQLMARSVTVVLVGAATAGRKWINYEIQRSWDSGIGVLGIRIHRLKDGSGRSSPAGINPFNFASNAQGRHLSTIVDLHEPSGIDGTDVYANIRANLDSWVEDAISARSQHAAP